MLLISTINTITITRCHNRFIYLSKTLLLRDITCIKPNLRFFSFIRSTRPMSRFAANTIMSGSDVLSFKNYDCIGFDLDNTLCHYNLYNMVKLEYEILSKFLVEQKHYDSQILYRNFDEEIDFLQKGLILDVDKGNILKLDEEATIRRACHGSKFLSENEIVEYYGPNKKWDIAIDYKTDMLQAWNGPMSERIRALLDYFDLPASLCFAQCVDTIDKKNGGVQSEYRIWPDILDGLIYMFSRDHFEKGLGEYFTKFKSNTPFYYHKCSPTVVNWVKELKKNNKTTFLITGSNVDYANLTAGYCIGPNWLELFDVVIYYSRKPGFFFSNRPFYSIKGMQEGEIIEDISNISLEKTKCYSQGNWTDLNKILSRHAGIDNPKTVYIGDNLLQDIYTPNNNGYCDTIAISEEIAAEGIMGETLTHNDAEVIRSSLWGSYFSLSAEDGVKSQTYWGNIIQTQSKICVPSLEALAVLPIDHEFLTFSEDRFCTAGFYPGPPLSIVKD